MAGDIAQIGFKADTSELSDAKKKLDDLSPAAGRAERSAEKLAKMLGASDGNASKFAKSIAGVTAANDNFAGSLGKAATAANLFKVALAGIGALIGTIAAGLSIGAYVKLADAWSDLSSLVGASVRNMELAPAIMSRLADVADRTYSSIQTTVEGFVGFNAAMRDMGFSINQTLDLTEALNNALVVSGAKGQRAESVMNALSKAMALGKLSGENLNTVIQQGGRIAEILAEELKTSQGGLMKFGAQGKITGDLIYNAMTKRMEELREAADAMPATVGDAFGRIGNAVLQTVGKFDQLTGITTTISAYLVEFSKTIKDVGNNFGLIAMYAAEAGIALGIAFSPAIIAGVYALALGVVKLTVAIGLGLIDAIFGAINAMVIFAMTNPFTALLFGITVTLAAFYVFRDAFVSVFGQDLINAAKNAVNKIIGFFVGAYQAIVAMWQNLPTMFSGLGKIAYNNFIAAFEKPALTFNGTTIIPGLDLSSMKAQLSDAEKSAMSLTNQTIKIAQGTDYIGAVDAAVSGLSSKFKVATGDADALDKKIKAIGGGSADDASGSGKEKKDPFSEIVKGAERTIEKLKAERDAIGLSAEETARLKRETELLNEAKQKNIDLTPDQIEKLKSLAGEMANLEASTAAAKKQLEFTKDLFKGFVSDIVNGLRQGKSFWEAFGDAATKVLNKIVDKLLNEVIDALFEVSKAGSGGGGGLLGTITSAIGSLFKFAKGGTFAGGINGHSNSVVSKPTLFAFASGAGVMGEKGPEAIMPLERGSDGSLGVKAFGNGGMTRNGTNVTVIVENNADNTNVRQERSTGGNGDEIRRIIIDTVNDGMAGGDFDGANAARYGAKVQRVAR